VLEFTKTQFAGVHAHLKVLELLKALRPFFRNLKVEDDSATEPDILMNISLDGYKTWYYPGTVDHAAATPLRLRPVKWRSRPARVRDGFHIVCLPRIWTR